MYAISGIILVFRSTDFLKTEIQYEKNIGPNIQAEKLGSILKIKGLKVDQKVGDVLRFKNGEYNQNTGQAKYKKTDLPYILDKMTKLHKANTNTRLYALNIFFGFALLFFVISSFWMFMPSSSVFKKRHDFYRSRNIVDITFGVFVMNSKPIKLISVISWTSIFFYTNIRTGFSKYAFKVCKN